MSSFRCSAGHLVTLTFEGDQVSLPCPACSAPVYKFRDVMLDANDSREDSDTEVAPQPRIARISFSPKKFGIVGTAGMVLLLTAVFVAKRTVPLAEPVSKEPVLPMAAAAQPPVALRAPSTTHATEAVALPKVAPTPENVAITDFKAVAEDSGTVKVNFRLVNHANPEAQYPALSIHWHGVAGADQLIRNDAYAHPPLPFTNADVTLELVRPHDAIGIDVKIVY